MGAYILTLNPNTELLKWFPLLQPHLLVHCLANTIPSTCGQNWFLSIYKYQCCDPLLLYHKFDQLFGHMSQGCLKRRVCLFVTGHATFWRQWQLTFRAFRLKILPKMAISKRFSSCHAARRQPKSCASLRGGHRSQATKTWSKWYSMSGCSVEGKAWQILATWKVSMSWRIGDGLCLMALYIEAINKSIRFHHFETNSTMFSCT